MPDINITIPATEIEIAEAIKIASLIGSGYYIINVIRKLAFERDILRAEIKDKK